MTDEQSNNGLNAAGGCAVDWSWLRGQRIASVTSALDSVTITFEGGLVFTTRALLWQGKPFLAFDPYAAPTPATAPPTANG
jgi:hypothetical protein